jgi:hypothetical protein
MRWIIFLFTLPASLQAQSSLVSVGARSAAMGNITTVIADEWALFNNIGALSSASNSAAFATQERSALPGATRSGAGLSIRRKELGLGIGFLRFGDAAYNEQQVIAGVSHRIQHTSLGIRVNLVQYRPADFPVRTAVSFDLGFLTQLTKQVSIGAYAVNSNRAQITDQELLPVRFNVGIGFHPASSHTLAIEAEKDLNYPVTVRLGFEYSFRSMVFFRCGVHLNPAGVSLGTGFRKKLLQVDASIRYGTMIGYTLQTTLGWRLSSISRT